ncbi:MAG: tetratricopeptide repeat protein [Candidatus Nitrosopolaris sp.]
MSNNDGKAWYDKTIEIDPKNTDAWNGKGVALYNLGRYYEAIKCYDKAIEIDPNDVSPWHHKGNALRNLGKHNEAIESYDRAVKIDPNYVLGWINKGNVLAKLGKQKDANLCFAKARELGFGETTRKQESSDLEKQQQRRKSMFRIFRR